MACTLALLHANGIEATFEELMEVLPDGEQFVGTRGGGMDHAACLSALPGYASLIEFQPIAVRHIAVPPDWRFLVAHSGVTAEKSGSVRERYNARRKAGSTALARLGASSYREILSGDLAAMAESLPTVEEHDAFVHVTSEALRVRRAVASAMEHGDSECFGRLLVESHASLRNRLHVSCEALDRLVDAALHAGALGARLTGAGFGGCVVVLCHDKEAEQVQEALQRLSPLCFPLSRLNHRGKDYSGTLFLYSMQLHTIDWFIALFSVAICFIPALFFGKRSGKSTAEFFASGRSVPWWLAGLSMVATTFSSDTPNLVANLVRTQGVAGNWQWWAFTLTGVATVFFYARLWRRSGVLTDLEFYELRYSGNAAKAVRGFRAVYLGFFFNCLIMATVNLAIRLQELPPSSLGLTAGRRCWPSAC